MKISKSKQEIARIISENGGWFEGAKWASQDKIGVEAVADEIAFYEEKPSYHSGSDMWNANQPSDTVKHSFPSGGLLKNWHQTILSREEYFHLYPAPDADGWIEWGGEPKSPVENGALVDVKLRSGAYYEGELLDDASWGDNWGNESIIAYRLSKPENNDLTQVNYINVVESKLTIEQLAADYHNAKDYAERKQQEADDAKADVGAKLKALELAGGEHGLLVSPVTTRQEPELAITDWRDLQVGDEIATHSGRKLTVTSLRCHDDSWPIDAVDGDGITWIVSLHDWRFISRP